MPTVLIIPSSDPSADVGQGVALATYVEALGEQLGTYAAYTVSTQASSGEANRLVIVDELRDDELARDFWAGGYCYVKQGYAQHPEQSRILPEGYEGPLGALVLARPYSTPLAVGTRVALSEPLPVREYVGVKGLRDLVVEALQRLEVEARIELTGNGTRRHSLAEYSFIRSKDDTLGIRDRGLGVSGEPATRSVYPYEIATDGADVALETAYAYPEGSTFELCVPVPAHRLTSDGTTWTYRDEDAPVLAHDDDQAAAPVKHVVALGMVKGLRYLMRRVVASRRMPPDEKRLRLADMADRLRPWAAAAAKILTYEQPIRWPDPQRGLVTVGGRWDSW